MSDTTIHILAPRQKRTVRQVVATMAIEDIHLPEETIHEMEAVAAGRKTPEQRIQELKEKYYR